MPHSPGFIQGLAAVAPLLSLFKATTGFSRPNVVSTINFKLSLGLGSASDEKRSRRGRHGRGSARGGGRRRGPSDRAFGEGREGRDSPLGSSHASPQIQAGLLAPSACQRLAEGSVGTPYVRRGAGATPRPPSGRERVCLLRVVGTSSPGVERRSHERPHTDAGAHAHADAGAGATTARAGPGEPAGVTLRTSTAGPNLPGAGNQAGGGPPGGAPHARRTGGVRLERSSSPYTSTPRSTSLRFRGVFSGRAQRSRRRSKEPIPSGPLPKGLRSTGAHRGGKVYPWRCDTP